MKILVSWLREFVDVTAAPAALADMLTLRGFEVASIDPVEGTDDVVIDLEITANRPDCLSVVGIAREVATIFDLPLRRVPPGLDVPGTATEARVTADGLTVSLEDADRCPRYAAAVADVRVGPSPEWLANRLTAAGVRPINNVVDVTNYVMLELGHPLHAFDLARLGGQTLRIRTARPGEKLHTLDGEERTLDADMLAIADADRAQAIAGVMGGAASEVWNGTKTIALESAYFKATSVRRTSKRVGLKTEASARFERGANIDAPVVALLRALALLEETNAGKSRGAVIDCYPSPRQLGTLRLRRARIEHLIGSPVADPTVQRVLDGLGFRPQPEHEGWQVTVPGWRVDVTREADLIEEVARHDGYDRVPATFPALATAAAPSDPRIGRDNVLRRVLTAAGFSEAITFVFIESAAARPFAGNQPTVALAYPLSEKFAVLRPSLLPGVVESVAYNRRRERRDIRLFEIGSTFGRQTGERRSVAFAWSGAAVPEHWSGPPRTVDFFDAKGVIETLCGALGVAVRFVPGDASYLVKGRQAAILCGNGAEAGVVGLLDPSIAEAREFPAGEEIYLAALDLEVLPQRERTDVESRTPPRFPSVTRDVSILVARTLPAEAVRGTIVAAAPPTLIEVREFDRYQGKGIPEDQVSLSFHLTFRAAERTLTDAEVQQAMDAIVDALGREHGAIRR